MKKPSDSPESTALSTPKKVALAVLGVLTLLTFANLIQAGVNKYKDLTHVVQSQKDFDVEVDVDVVVSENDHRVLSINAHKNAGTGELMIEETFKVSDGENLSVAVGDADIVVETSNDNTAVVEVYLDGRDMEKAKEYFENQRFEVLKEGNTVYVKTHPERVNYGWNRDGGAQITVQINIPVNFNASLKTSDGDIVLGALNGEVTLHSSDGDINTAALSGPAINVRTSDGDIMMDNLDASNVSIATSDGDISLNDILSDDISIRTSDGDIKAEILSGNASVSTSDGDIFIETMQGDEVAVRTSDGEILANKIEAAHSEFQTSDGSIVLKRVSGELTAKTSSGDLNVSLEGGQKVYLRTGDGNIYISAPQNYAAELSLKGERVRISSGFQFDGKLKEKEAEGRINGGGESIEASTSDGEVVFREN